ncbi:MULTISPECIES: hypothetical protein [unclassified Rhodococcus (in: high G+C Gram-positive bacteria)]|uniref:hypothetical protein n=1 Tax=Rhodococcus sp. SJ-3 TaxID=3454628 RepID=UPI002DAE608E|nr:hypothetical protein [Rhodococcus sp. (in: high G+C Gram-positive bacteria)]
MTRFDVILRLRLRRFRQGHVEWMWKASFELLTRGSSDRAKTNLQSIGSGTLET